MNQDRSEAGHLPNRAAEGALPAGRARAASASHLLQHIFFGGLYALCGYLLGTCALPFGCYPLGIAWLCAVERHVPWVLAGALLAGLGLPDPGVWVLALSVALVIRAVVRLTLDKPRDSRSSGRALWRHLFSEQVGLRMTTACVTAFFVGVYRLVEGGFLYYDLYGALLSMIVSPVAVLLFYGVSRRDFEAHPRRYEIGLLSLLVAVVYAARDLRVAYLSVSAFVAMAATMALVKHRGVVVGVLAGVLCGLAYMPSMVPLFALGALCCGLLFPLSVPLGATVFVIVGSTWAFYARGLAALSGLIPALLSAGVLFAVVDKLFLQETAADKAADADAKKEQTVVCEVLCADRARLASATARIEAVCESFSAMAHAFEAMASTMQRPSAEELRSICENAFDSSCASCQGRESCREACAGEIDAEISYLSSVLYREGQVEARSVSPALAGRCTRLPDMLDEINHNATTYAARVLQSDKSEIFAADYAAMAEILSEIVTAANGADESDGALCARLAECLQGLNFGICGVLVWEGRVSVRSREVLTVEQIEAVGNAIGEQVGAPMSYLSSELCEDGVSETTFGARERFSVSFARRTLRAVGEEEYCGDSACVFRRGGRQYALISDGMGAGREAALTSGLCALFLQNLLGICSRPETVLQLLNVFLRSKGGDSLHECSATVDLLAWDLCDGSASFYKCGAAPTYVFRAGSLFKIRSQTLPIGILRKTDQKRVAFSLSAGDVIVMVSDGVTQGREECPWLYDLLRQSVDRDDLEETADRIVRHAKAEGSTDDLSVLLLRVEES